MTALLTLETPFILLCQQGKLDECKLYYQNHPNINIYKNDDYIFRTTCKHGQLDVAKWLYQTWYNIQCINTAFFDACSDGYLELARWLHRICPKIDVQLRLDFAFTLACESGHLHIAQWLYDICPRVHIQDRKNMCFSLACRYGHLHIAQWFDVMTPYYYLLKIENNEIIEYGIKTEKDRKWDRRKMMLYMNQIPPTNTSPFLWKIPIEVGREICQYL